MTAEKNISPDPLEGGEKWTEAALRRYEQGGITAGEARLQSQAELRMRPETPTIGEDDISEVPEPTTKDEVESRSTARVSRKNRSKRPLNTWQRMFLDIGQAAVEHKSPPYGHKPFEGDDSTEPSGELAEMPPYRPPEGPSEKERSEQAERTLEAFD